MRLSSRTIVALALAYHMAGVLYAAFQLPFPNGFDEIQHNSYARSMRAAPAVLPHYPVGQTLDATATRWTEEPNYLNHPSPYYIAMGWLDYVSGSNVLALRLANVALSLLGIGLALAGGMRLLSGVAERATFAAILVAFPKLAVVGGIVNNDNAALVASGLLFLGFAGWARDREHGGSRWIMAIALVLAGWTKFTVFVAGVLVILAYEAIAAVRAREGPAQLLTRCRLLAVPAVAMIIGAIPYADSVARYGRVLWHPANFYVRPEDRVALDLAHYVQHFFNLIGDGWASMEPTPLFMQAGFVLIMALYTGAWVARRHSSEAQDRVAIAYAIATLGLIAMHVAFGWAAYKEDGYLAAAQVRYYYAVWPGVALALASGQAAMRAGPVKQAVAFACALLVIPASLQFVFVAKSALWALPAS